MRKVSFILFLFLGTSLLSQELSIDFENLSLSDWEESTPDRWHVDTNDAFSGIGSLHHNFDSDEASYDMITYGHTQLHLDSASTVWQFSVRYNYAPSSGNNWSFWLSSSKQAYEIYPAGSSKGYVVGVNYTGSDDKVKLWRQSEGELTEVIASNFNWQENELIGKKVDFKVTRSIQGDWNIQVDTSNSSFFSIGSGSDNLYTKSEYIGVYYKYSATNDRKLWLDDIEINGFFREDTEPPVVSSFIVQEQNQILLNFNEAIDTTVSTLFVLDRKHKPVLINWIDAYRVELLFDKVFESENLLEIYNLADLKANVSQLESIIFNYYKPQKFDVIISEIMADPNPVVELPECEYVELFNRSDKSLDLSGWQFFSGTRNPIVLESFVLTPQAHLLLIDEEYFSEFPDSINLMSFTSLPSLPNTGETLFLLDKYGNEIYRIAYTSDWHTDPSKEEGGWSLEILDTDYPCVTTNNWESSLASEGGTPGYRNSVDGVLENYPTSVLISLTDITKNSCTLIFSETLDSSFASNTAYFKLDNPDVEISSVIPKAPWFKEVVISFSESLDLGELYTLSVSEDLVDCSGREVLSEPITFGVTQNPDSSDLIINEVLFEATEFVPEFVELYNNSGKIIDLSGMKLANIDVYGDTIKESKVIVSPTRQIFPGEFMVLTENMRLLKETFSELQSSRIIQSESWLNLLSNGGKLGLLNMNDSIIDKAVYAPEMHFALLESTKGVSLERISALESGINTNNWHSASTGVGYASPGKENSQSYLYEEGISMVSIDPKKFSPDNDGRDDFLTIQYNFPKSGYVAGVKIYTQRGLLVNHLVNNELCGTTGSFVWDGLDENSGRLAMGYYIIFFEAWHPDGDVIKEKLVCLRLPETK